MREAMQRANALGKLICAHCEDDALRAGGHIRESDLARQLGIPGIPPESEYRHRLSEQERLLSLLPGHIPLLACGYDHEAFEAFAPAMADAPEGGERCLACFALRLDYTARQAKEHGFEYFTTTLSVSPHKNADNVNRAGEAAGRKAGVKYLYTDFKKRNGYLRSLQLSKEYQLYRQDYCGCRYSGKGTEERSQTSGKED